MFQFSIVSTVLVIMNALQHKKCYNVLENEPSLILPSVHVTTRPINTGFSNMGTLFGLQPQTSNSVWRQTPIRKLLKTN